MNCTLSIIETFLKWEKDTEGCPIIFKNKWTFPIKFGWTETTLGLPSVHHNQEKYIVHIKSLSIFVAQK